MNKRGIVLGLGLFALAGCADGSSSSGIDGMEISAGQCQDAVDNDGDGLTDCADVDCQGFVFCVDGGSDSDTDTDTDTDSDSDSDSDAGCLEGAFSITNGLDVDIFEPYTCITGSLGIGAAEMNSVVLPNLQSIGGAFSLGSCPTTLEIPNLDTIGSTFSIYSCPEELDLSNLKTIGSDVIYKKCEVPLELPGLETIGGNFEIDHYGGYVADSPAEIVDFTSLNEIAGDLILYIYYVENLDGFSALSSVGGDIIIQYNYSLTDLEGLSNLTSVGGSLDINTNELLTDLTGLGGITSFTNVTIQNTSLTSLDGLDSLASVNGNVDISYNTDLVDLGGMSALTSITGWLRINNNEALPYCEVCTLLDQLDAPPTTVTCGGNLADSCWVGSVLTCP